MNTTSTTMNRMPLRSGIAWKVTLILIPVITLGVLLWLRNLEISALRQRTVSSYGSVPMFQLTNQNGQPFGSGQLDGKIWIADFIYTTCPGPCPMISGRMSELQKPLEKSDVHLVSFSVDPEKDTPADSSNRQTTVESDFLWPCIVADLPARLHLFRKDHR